MSISIKDYLEQTKYVTEKLISLLNDVDYDLANLNHTTAMIPYYQQNARMYDDFSKMLRADGQPEEAFDYVIRSIEKAKTVGEYQEKVQEIQTYYNNALLIKNSPRQSLAQAILQIGKQGISSKYGKLKGDCSTELQNAGKVIDTRFGVSILDIIWEGRNQSIHYEDMRFNTPTKTCLNNLIQNSDSKCQALVGYDNGENKAYEIIKILDWTDYANFERDLMSLSI